MTIHTQNKYPETGVHRHSTLVLCMLIALAACWPARAWTEIIRWQDEKGYWHFTEGPASHAQPSQQEPATPESRPSPEPPGDRVDQDPGSQSHAGLLWRISAEGRKSSYLLGTIHSEDSRVTRLKPAVVEALDASERFVMEMILDNEAFMQFGAAMTLPPDTDLEKQVGPDTYGRVVSAMADYGLPEPAVRKLKPWVVIAMLSMPKSTGGRILDMVLYQRATALGKPASGLESAKEQLAVFEGLSIRDQVELLKMTLEQLPSQQRMFEQLIEAYAADDLNRIADIAKLDDQAARNASARKFMVRLNDNRNLRMVQRIIPYLESGNAFIAVGAMHLAGPGGILSLIRQKGYSAESVH